MFRKMSVYGDLLIEMQKYNVHEFRNRKYKIVFFEK